MISSRSPAPLGPAVRAAAFPVSVPRPCPPPPPPYSMAISSGSRIPLRGQVSVCWWVRDNPAQRARARAQVAALARRGTECLLYTSITYKFLYLLVLPNLVSHYVYLWTSVKKIPCNVNCFSTSKL